MSKAIKIVAYSYKNLEKPYYDELQASLGVDFLFCQEAPSLENAHLAEGADGVTVITSPIDAPLIERFHQLGVRYIGTRCVGYDHIDIERAKQLGIAVGNATYSPHNVAEYTMMLILMVTRKGKEIANAFDRQDYSRKGKMGILLEPRTVGVIGTGKIGSTLIRILSGFGCKILAYDPYKNPEVAELAKYVSLDTLYAESDIITLHIPATEENYHLINKHAIAKMKDGVILVNTARGSLIHTEDLIEALESKKVGFAALDVVEGETAYYYKNFEGQELDHKGIVKLNALPNTLMTAHMAFFTQHAIYEMVTNATKGCVLELRGEPNPYKIV